MSEDAEFSARPEGMGSDAEPQGMGSEDEPGN